MDYLVMKALFQLMIDKSHFYMEDDDMSLLNYALVE